MTTIIVTYTPKWQLSFAPHYQWTDAGLCFNIKTGKKIKQVYNNGSIGYCINGKFMSMRALRSHIEKTKSTDIPF